MVEGIDRANHASSFFKKAVQEGTKHIDIDLGFPTLLVVSDQDYCTRAEIQKLSTIKWAKQLRIEELNCGH